MIGEGEPDRPRGRRGDRRRRGRRRLPLVRRLPAVTPTASSSPLIVPDDPRVPDTFSTHRSSPVGAPDPSAPLEVALGERTARRLGVVVGDPVLRSPPSPRRAAPTARRARAHLRGRRHRAQPRRRGGPRGRHRPRLPHPGVRERSTATSSRSSGRRGDGGRRTRGAARRGRPSPRPPSVPSSSTRSSRGRASGTRSTPPSASMATGAPDRGARHRARGGHPHRAHPGPGRRRPASGDHGCCGPWASVAVAAPAPERAECTGHGRSACSSGAALSIAASPFALTGLARRADVDRGIVVDIPVLLLGMRRVPQPCSRARSCCVAGDAIDATGSADVTSGATSGMASRAAGLGASVVGSPACAWRSSAAEGDEPTPVTSADGRLRARRHRRDGRRSCSGAACSTR